MTAASTEDAKAHLAALLSEALRSVAPGLEEVAVTLDRPKHAGHGDYACSVALQLAKQLRAKPRDIAVSRYAARGNARHDGEHFLFERRHGASAAIVQS